MLTVGDALQLGDPVRPPAALPPRTSRSSRRYQSDAARLEPRGRRAPSWRCPRRAGAADRGGARQDRSQEVFRVSASCAVLDAEKNAEQEKAMSSDSTPSIPSGCARRCATSQARRHPRGRRAGDPELRPAVDPDLRAGHRLNSGALAAWRGPALGVGAKVAKPDTQVLVLHGDGSYGMNAMEIDTAVRHRIPSSSSSRTTADGRPTRRGAAPAQARRNLGRTRYDPCGHGAGRAR